jgi:hypothetical protein
MAQLLVNVRPLRFGPAVPVAAVLAAALFALAVTAQATAAAPKGVAAAQYQPDNTNPFVAINTDELPASDGFKELLKLAEATVFVPAVKVIGCIKPFLMLAPNPVPTPGGG